MPDTDNIISYESCQPSLFIADRQRLLSLSDQEFLKKLRPQLNNHLQEIQRHFEDQLDGITAVTELAQLVDNIVMQVSEFISNTTQIQLHNNQTNNKNIIVCATNNYGLGYYLPFGTLNLICLTKEKIDDETHASIKRILRLLWELGFKVRARISDLNTFLSDALINGNTSIQLLTLRPIIGDTEISKSLIKEFHTQVSKERKRRLMWELTDARKYRHLKHDTSLLSSDLLNRIGGIRDIISLSYTAELLCPQNIRPQKEGENLPAIIRMDQLFDSESRLLRKLWSFLWNVLVLYQYRSASFSTCLNIELLPLLAHQLGYRRKENSTSIQRLLRHLSYAYRMVERISLVVEPYFIKQVQLSSKTLDRSLQAGELPHWLTISSHGRLRANPKELFKKPLLALKALEFAVDKNLPISTTLKQTIIRMIFLNIQVSQDSLEPQKILLKILSTPQNIKDRSRDTSLIYFLNLSGILSLLIPHWRMIKGYFEIDNIHNDGHSIDDKIIKMFELLHEIELKAAAEENKKHESYSLPLTYAVLDNLSEKRALYVAIFGYHMPQIFGVEKATQITKELCRIFSLSEAETEKAHRLVLCQNLLSDVILSPNPSTSQDILRLASLIQTPNFLKLLFVQTVLSLKTHPEWDYWLQAIAVSLFHKIHKQLTPVRLNPYEKSLLSYAYLEPESSSIHLEKPEIICRVLLEKVKATSKAQYEIRLLENVRAAQVNIVANEVKVPIASMMAKLSKVGFPILQIHFCEFTKGYYALTACIHYPATLRLYEGDVVHPFFKERVKEAFSKKAKIVSIKKVLANVQQSSIHPHLVWTPFPKQGYLQLELSLFYIKGRAVNLVNVLERNGIRILAGQICCYGGKEIYVIRLKSKDKSIDVCSDTFVEKLTTEIEKFISFLYGKNYLKEAVNNFKS